MEYPEATSKAVAAVGDRSHRALFNQVGPSTGGKISFILLAALILTIPASGVILYRTGDPAANTTEPIGALAGSGWQYQGKFGAFLGTAIAPHYFITAKHIGQVSDKFVFQGANHTIARSFADADSDLRIFQVEGPLPKYASLYRRPDEVGKSLIVIGRGTQRGAERIVNGQLRGWEYGAADSVSRWGENRVARIVGGTLYVLFRQSGLPQEAHVSAGDSGGAVFIKDDGTWKLAGITSDVDSFVSGSDRGGPYHAAMFDQRGLYRSDGTLVTGNAPVPSGFYAVRISQRAAWIDKVLGATADTR